MAEPILWTHADNEQEKGSNSPRRTLRYRDEDGRVVIERVPARCSADDNYDSPTVHTGYQRWLPIIRDDGNAVRIPLTNAAAHVDTNTGYARNQIEKWKRNGGFRFDECPLAQIYGKTAWKQAFISPEVLEDLAARVTPCEGTSETRPCRHTKAEQAARQQRRRDEDNARERARMGEVERAKHDLNQRLVAELAAGNKQTAEMIQTFMAMMANVVGGGQAPAPAPTNPPPATTPPGGKKG